MIDIPRYQRGDRKASVFLDSGAFSAKSKGSPINIDDYIAFVKKNKHLLAAYANLDVIGDPEQTLRNQEYMEDAGLSPVPVFHYHENEVYLNNYLELGYEYIALGGMVPISNPKLMEWLDHLFSKYFCDHIGLPNVKIHGFGLSSVALVVRYPWYSIDSASWIFTSRMGQIFVPIRRNDQWVYDETPMKVRVTNQIVKKSSNKFVYQNLTSTAKRYTDMYIADLGYSIGHSTFRYESPDYSPIEGKERWADHRSNADSDERLLEVIEVQGISNDYKLRDEMCLEYFKRLNHYLNEHPVRFKNHRKIESFL